MSPGSPSGAPNAARGVVLVVAAGLLGLVLLARGGNSSLISTGSSNASGHVTTTTAPVPTVPDETTTVAPPATNKPADVTVAVFNGTGGKDPNAAGNNKAKLTPLGYSQVTIADTTAAPKSAVYYSVAGAQGDAVAVDSALGLPRSAVTSSANAASLPPGAQGASVIVIIGEDSAAGSTP
jgi:hypothetical protein